MNIRPATIADLARCERLDGSYSTQYVWQLDEDSEQENLTITLRRLRLPRRMTVPYPRETEDLFRDWQRSECFLVADEEGTILGFLDMVVHRWRWQGWIEHLLVHPPYRRKGVANLLLAAAERWARGSELSAITIALQSKNDPAIRLLLKRGYTFSGFIDHYYSNGDIALLYALEL
ncbi:GNAT family N-acetyltransferase [bacterium]|nr:GNAT family N-acetyltransferase [bacterium]